jgi:hypothetical protein
MLRKIIFLCHFVVLACSFAFCEAASFEHRYQKLNLACISFFDGDKYGDFKNDFVANLNDGSAWKVHLEDQNLFCQWDLEDVILIRVRTSFYWFKREHKFELYNESRQEAVRVMLVRYPEVPLYIVESETHISGYHMSFYTTTDGYGNIHYHYYPIYTYATTIILSDGSHWNIDEYCHFNDGEKAYIFLDQKSHTFILITEIERDARWKEIMLKSVSTN